MDATATTNMGQLEPKENSIRPQTHRIEGGEKGHEQEKEGPAKLLPEQPNENAEMQLERQLHRCEARVGAYLGVHKADLR
jgi:hypothetical protein